MDFRVCVKLCKSSVSHGGPQDAVYIVAAQKKKLRHCRRQSLYPFSAFIAVCVKASHVPFWCPGHFLIDALIRIQNSVKQDEANPATCDYVFP